jgi:hypothetical protein
MFLSDDHDVLPGTVTAIEPIAADGEPFRQRSGQWINELTQRKPW